MRVKIKKLHPDAVIPFKKHNSDFCYDLTCISVEEIATNTYKYGFGLAFQIDMSKELNLWGLHEDNVRGDYTELITMPSRLKINLSIDGRPRSSVYKHGMMLTNAVATIDKGYINEVSAIFWHYNTDLPRYEIGDRILQIKIGITFPIEFEEVDELSETDRGMGGYGSTGK